MTMAKDDQHLRISGLDALIRASLGDRRPPVETWDPPHCGDIGLAIRRDGSWTYQGSPIGRQRIVKLFSRILRREPDGSFVLVTPVEKIVVAVEDAPFLAVELDVQDYGRPDRQVLTFRTNVDDLVRVDRAHPLRFCVEPVGGGLKPYVRVRGGLEALVTRSLTMTLVELATPRGTSSGASPGSGPGSGPGAGEDAADAPLGMWSDGAWFALPSA